MRKIIFLFAFWGLLACGNDDDANNNIDKSQDIDIVTGIKLKDEVGTIFAEYGNPNTLVENILVYPNPAFDFVSIDSSEDILVIWLVSGNKSIEYSNVNFTSILTSNSYSENEIERIAELKFSKAINDEDNSEVNNENIDNLILTTLDIENTFDVDSILINTSELKGGYYRVFVKTESGIYWDNIYVSNEKLDLVRVDFFEDEF